MANKGSIIHLLQSEKKGNAPAGAILIQSEHTLKKTEKNRTIKIKHRHSNVEGVGFSHFSEENGLFFIISFSSFFCSMADYSRSH